MSPAQRFPGTSPLPRGAFRSSHQQWQIQRGVAVTLLATAGLAVVIRMSVTPPADRAPAVGAPAVPARTGARIQDSSNRSSPFGHLPAHALKCTTIIVGPDASSDGSALLAHNEDLGQFSAQHYLVVPRQVHAPGETITLWSGALVPQVEVTFAYGASTIFDIDYIPGDITSGENEYQVSIANNLAYEREATEPYPTGGRMIWTEFTRLALERATSAREAVLLMGSFAETYKLGSDPGTMFGIVDPDEGWWIEIAQEGQWVAERVPTDGASMRANAYSIGEVDFDDPETFLYSDDLVSYAVTRGWYSSSDGPFNFAAVYGDPKEATAHYNTHRKWRVETQLEAAMPGIAPADLLTILRDHYEGTVYDPTHGYTSGSPHHTRERPVCVMSTEVAVVCQSRGWLPAEIGGLCWRSMTTPCSGVFVPWYLGQLEVPAAYERGTNRPTPDSAYWTFRNLSMAVDRDYGASIGAVHDTWASFEADELSSQAQLEAAALSVYATNPLEAREMLTNYTNDRAQMALKTARSLVPAR